MWLIQLTIEYKYSPAMVLSYQNGEDMVVANGTLRSPEGIAVDSSSGNVYVADTDNNRIQVFSSNGDFHIKMGKIWVVLMVPLRSPEDIAVDQEGNVYVADTANNRIQVFSSNGTFISKWGGYGLVKNG